jgi:hypothetical protein
MHAAVNRGSHFFPDLLPCLLAACTLSALKDAIVWQKSHRCSFVFLFLVMNRFLCCIQNEGVICITPVISYFSVRTQQWHVFMLSMV